jgi:glycosyltransferase involved in cell wall biosynthesis
VHRGVVCGIVRPAVSVAIPTFNRRDTLRRAVDSALAQTFEDLEVVVSDNGSTDGTAELLAELARADDRVRVVRQPSNVGMVANLDAAARLAEGRHVMLLADDDWLAPRCVAASLSALEAEPGLAGALGRVAYMREGTEVPAGQPTPLRAADPGRRVRDYFAAVGRDHGNSWLYALTRRELVQALPPLRNVLGFDWLRVAEIAFAGKIAVLDETLIFRELGGTSETTARNVRESGLPALHAKAPHLAIAREVLADVGWRSPAYSPLGRARRLTLAAACAAGVPARNLQHVAFHLAPAGLQRRWQARA